MKTTIDINAELLESARRTAAKERTTVKALVEDGLRRILEDKGSPTSFLLRKATFRGRGLRKELEGKGWAKIRDAAYEGRGG
jgi:hypothetical protein